MVGYATLFTTALLTVSASLVNALNIIVPTPCTYDQHSVATGFPIPVGHRDPHGLDALAERKRRYFGCAFDVDRMSDTNYTQLVLAQFGQITPENSLKWEVTVISALKFALLVLMAPYRNPTKTPSTSHSEIFLSRPLKRITCKRIFHSLGKWC